ncbi:FAD-dependent monooxygenase [Microtetraspora sp. NBRC 16547]|uniref:FAD-dependent monooxygenase n=1 Tax=Microtetraspora sp. NBRC 16547 TaxID=3030993 RepID=UPI0024A1D029|nr:FAD-dependent monooxygenase [Microtetraspora sp. NBRC 16547]GLX02360.1 FAD-dependent oxidoreductase [Microtetraspora sp. NBRC 16547]
MTNVLISGGGIAGTALAYWLRRYGFTVTVVERAPAPRLGGHTVDLRGAAREVVERMGLLQDARRVAVDSKGMSYVDEAGRRVADMPASFLGGAGVVGELEILRGDLVELLHRATGDETEYVFDDTITALTQTPEGVHVTFERSAPRVFDVVVGADGTHSLTRSLAFGPESRFSRDLGCYTAYFTARNVFDIQDWELFYNIPGQKMAALRPSRRPEEAKVLFGFASEPLDYDHRDQRRQKEIVAEVFAGAGWHIPAMLREMEAATDFYLDSATQIVMDGWSHGRVVLLGDAGYGPSSLGGNGTGLALVGAYVLAGELAAAGGEHKAAFAAYEREMRAFVKQNHKLPPGGVNGFVPKSELAIRMRNLSIKLTPHMPWAGLIEKAVSRADAITLKDYPYSRARA